MISVWLCYHIFLSFSFFSWGWPFLLSRGLPFLLWGLALPWVNCGITREPLTSKVFFYIMFFLLKINTYANVLDIGEGQQWNRARRIYPKSRCHGRPVQGAGCDFSHGPNFGIPSNPTFRVR